MHADKLGFGDDLAAFAESVIGAGLSPQTSALIAQAAALYEQPQQAQALLEQARAQAPQHPAPLIALYRFHFYGHRLDSARAAGDDAASLTTAIAANPASHTGRFLAPLLAKLE